METGVLNSLEKLYITQVATVNSLVFKYIHTCACVCVCVYICIFFMHIYLPLNTSRMWHKVKFKQSITGLNSEFSFSKTGCHNTVEEPSLPNYYPIDGVRIIGFLRVLVLRKMQTASSRIWSWVSMSISSDGNYDTMNIYIYIYIYIWRERERLNR